MALWCTHGPDNAAPWQSKIQRHRRRSSNPPGWAREPLGPIPGDNAQRRPVSADAAPNSPKLHPLAQRTLDLLQEQLEQRVPLALPIATPPRWKRPWAKSPRKGSKSPRKGLRAGDALLPPVETSAEALTPQAPPGGAFGAGGSQYRHRRPTSRTSHIQDAGGDAALNSSPRKRSRQMMSRVLDQLLPLHVATSSTNAKDGSVELQTTSLPEACLQRGEFSSQRPFSVDPGQSQIASERRFAVTGRPAPLDTDDVTAKVAAFRVVLSKSFGNLTRAFRAMKNAVTVHHDTACASYLRRGSVSSQQHPTGSGLSCAEFEWCVSSYLHYGDCSLARQIFVALDWAGKGKIGLLELSQPPRHRGLMSMVEFRRLLLERHVSLERAFRELEEYMDSHPASCRGASPRLTNRRAGRNCRTVQLPEFVNATAFFGLNAEQASHFFGLMDIDGDRNLSFTEFLDALTRMPRNVLLQDLRQRLLTQYPTVSDAFRHLIAGGSHSRKLDSASFRAVLAPLGVLDVEAAEIFRIFDEDASGDVSLDELREAMREIAPTISMESFWQRFAAEWPQVRAAARIGGSSGSHRAGALLLELLPEDIRQRCGITALPRLGGQMCHEALGEGPSAATSDLPARLSLIALTSEVFDAFATLLDISRANASDLFQHITAAARKQCGNATQGDAQAKTGLTDGEEREVDMEDFLEQMQLWTDNPLSIQVSQRASTALRQPAALNGLMAEMLAPSRAAISALKAELAPEAHRPQEKASSRCGRRPSKLPKAPWQKCSPALPTMIYCA